MPRPRPWQMLAAALLLTAGGCANRHLGHIDETRDERDDMRGAGIFAGEDGETTLKWKPGQKQGTAAGAPPASGNLDDRDEFELFKEWRRLRAEGTASAEYREFLQWLEFREFKAVQ